MSALVLGIGGYVATLILQHPLASELIPQTACLYRMCIGGGGEVPVGFIEPSHPTLRDEAPSGARWVHEIKFDGYRAQAHLREGRPAIYPRRAYDWTRRFQPIADALVGLPANALILDGEAVVADSLGIPDFGLLHADLAVYIGASAAHVLREIARRISGDLVSWRAHGTFLLLCIRLQHVDRAS